MSDDDETEKKGRASTSSARTEEEVSALRRSSGEPSLDGGPRSFDAAQDRPSSDRTDPPSRGASADEAGRGANRPLRRGSGQASTGSGLGGARKSRRKKARPALGPDDRIHGGRNREAQIVRNPARKLFNRARKKAFLEWFAATANLGWAAEEAGVTRQTVSKHLMSDPEFAGGYEEALKVSRLRLKAKVMETKKPAAPIAIDGDSEAPDIDMPTEKALAVLREMDREVVLGRKQGRTPRIASNAEVVAVVRKRFKVFAARMRARGRGGDTPTDPDLRAGGESTPTPTLPPQGGGS